MALAFALVGVSSAEAYQAAPGWTASDYATGFPVPVVKGYAGPLGLAFDGRGNLFVADDATLYRVPPGGGSAAGSAVRSGYGHAAGLAFGKDGRLYMARGWNGDVVEVDPSTGVVLRTVVRGMPCATGLATDPVSGDLFVSTGFCTGGAIMRVSGFSNGLGTATRYAGAQDADGLTFAPDGTLYAAAPGKVVRIEGTASPSHGAVSDVGVVPTADGVAFSPATPLDVAYLVVVRNDGEIDRLDFNGKLTPVVTGTSRGDLATVGPDHCIYADLLDRVIKLGPARGQCGFAVPVGPAARTTTGTGSAGGQQSAPMVDLAIKAKAAKRVRRAKRMTVTLTVSDRSDNNSHALTVTDVTPKGAKFVRVRSLRSVTCKRHKRTITCRKSSLAHGQSFAVKISLQARRGKRYVNTARVKSKDLDPVPGNNRSHAVTRLM